MKVLVTGSAGYVGAALVTDLQKDHEVSHADVVAFEPDRVPWVYEALGVERTPEHLPKPDPKLPFHKGSILEMDYCRKITEGVDAVIHLSGNVKHDEDPALCFTVNASGTFNMVRACEENGVRRFLCASSINAMGWFYCRVTQRPRDWPYLPVDEDYPTDHEDAYSLSKFCNELTCQAWTNRTGMTTAAFRFSGVFPPEWTDSHAKDAKPAEKWDEELASYVDRRDVVRGLRQALECKTLPDFGVYALVAPDTQYLEPTMDIIARFRPELLERIREPLPGRTTMLSWKRAHDAFGYTPRHSWLPV